MSGQPGGGVVATVTIMAGCILLGAIVAFLTSSTIGSAKARYLPGGSMIAGAMMGSQLFPGWSGLVAGALLGILGWAIYVLIALTYRNWNLL